MLRGIQERNVERGQILLEEGEVSSGHLPVRAQIVLGRETASGELGGRLVIELPVGPSVGAQSAWVVSFVATAIDDDPFSQHEFLSWQDGSPARGWRYEADVLIPGEFQDAAVVVEDVSTGQWGAVTPEWPEAKAQIRPDFVSLGGRHSAANQGVQQALLQPARPTPPSETSVIQILQPTDRPAIGRVRIQTVTSLEGIRSAIFFLDGQQVAVDERRPFSAVLDFGPEPRPATVTVKALGYRNLELGSDEIRINEDVIPFAVNIQSIQKISETHAKVSVAVTAPPWETIERVEFFANDRLEQVQSSDPFEVELATGFGSGDFVRVVAHLENGDSQEDARIVADALAGVAVSERIEVNLVEVYAVVTDRDDQPVTNLDVEDFTVKMGKRQIPVDTFGLAGEVPLVLGVIIDSSESMDPLMVDTQRAAAQFLGQTVKAEDRAFLVDFDTHPKLAQSLTGDVPELLRSLQKLRVGGNTAIYDALVFSLAQFEAEPGRRALVLLTDGRDYGSKFSTKRSLADARRLGVPVYVIVLNNLQNLIPGAVMRKKPAKAPPVDAFLESYSRNTGGRLFSITETAALREVYATINAELRSQYLLAFSTDQALSDKELQSIDVDIETRGLSVRRVVLGR